MTTIVSRLKAIQKHYNLNDSQLAERLNMVPQTIGNQLKERRKVSLETIVAIGSCMPEVSLDWLIKGEGEMLRTESRPVSNTVYGNGDAVSGVKIQSDSTELTTLLKKVEELREQNYTLTNKLLKLMP